MFKGIDLYSDTVTRPTPGMRKAMAEAEVGDEQVGEDPTTRHLEEWVADKLGHNTALFFPSATMANQIAIRTLCDRGDELVAAEDCHLFFAEAGGVAVHSGVMTRALPTPTGVYSGAAVEKAFRKSKGPHYPVTRLLSVENTSNMGGGIAWTEPELDDVLTTGKKLGMRSHMDGARFFNASVKTGMSPRAIASRFDTVTICLSKGLGCPAGAVLAFDKAYFPVVRRLKQQMGGSLRQSGILAAAGLYALQHHVERLHEDHSNALLLARGLAEDFPYLAVENPTPATNMVFFRWTAPKVSATRFNEACRDRGVRFSQVGEDRLRAVTHLDIQREDIPRALSLVREVCRQI